MILDQETMEMLKLQAENYIHKPIHVRADGLVQYRCDDGSECDKKELSPWMKKLRTGRCWVCGDCRGNF